MSRKSFLSADFFVSTSETEAKRILLSLPGYVSQLSLLKEDTIIHSTRFLYRNAERGTEYYVDVTILQLNDQYVRFSLHVSYANGQSIQAEADLRNVLTEFEKSVHAVATEDFSLLQEASKPLPTTKKSFSFTNTILSMFLSKYHY